MKIFVTHAGGAEEWRQEKISKGIAMGEVCVI